MSTEGFHLSDEEKHKVMIQVDHFIEILSARYGLRPNDVVDTVQWVKERRQFVERMKVSSALSILGVVVAALLLSMWEGIKVAIGSGGKP